MCFDISYIGAINTSISVLALIIAIVSFVYSYRINRKRVMISDAELDFDEKYPCFSFCVDNLGRTPVTLLDVHLYNKKGNEIFHNGYDSHITMFLEPFERSTLIKPMEQAQLGYFLDKDPGDVTVVLTFKENVKGFRKKVIFSNLASST